jgi:hypothetical protein
MEVFTSDRWDRRRLALRSNVYRPERRCVCPPRDIVFTCGPHPTRNGTQRKLNAQCPTFICLTISYDAGGQRAAPAAWSLPACFRRQSKTQIGSFKRKWGTNRPKNSPATFPWSLTFLRKRSIVLLIKKFLTVQQTREFSTIFMTASVVWWSEFLATDPEVLVRFPALPDFLRSSESVTGSIQPREYDWGATTKK